MKECWDEGGLRAYLDRELPPEELTRIAVHLGGCAECHARYNELAGRAARVAALMETLEVGQAVAQLVPARRHWKIGRPRSVAAVVLALAATAALAFVSLPKRNIALANQWQRPTLCLCGRRLSKLLRRLWSGRSLRRYAPRVRSA